MVVGAHPWVYDARLPNRNITPNLEDIFMDIKFAGYEGIELIHQPLRSMEAAKKIEMLVAKYMLPVIGSSYSAPMWDATQHEAILKDIAVVLENLRQVGGRTLDTSVGNAKHKKTESELDAQAEIPKKISAIADSKGIVVNLHNHAYEVQDDMHDLKGTLKKIPDIKLGPDLDWIVYARINPVEFINDFGDKVVFLHLRDRYEDGKWTECLGQGTTDFRAIGKALKNIGFSGDLGIELAHEKKNFELTQTIQKSLKKSRKFMERTMGIK